MTIPALEATVKTLWLVKSVLDLHLIYIKFTENLLLSKTLDKNLRREMLLLIWKVVYYIIARNIYR